MPVGLLVGGWESVAVGTTVDLAADGDLVGIPVGLLEGMDG